MLILPFLLFPFLSFPVLAQGPVTNDFVILNSGDTLYGEVQTGNLDRTFTKCLFKAREGSTVKQYLPADLLAYRSAEMYYESVELDEQGSEVTVFMETLAKGRATLYKYYDRYFIKKDADLVELTSEEFEKINENGTPFKGVNKKYIGVLNYLLGDCSKVTARIDQVSLSERSLVPLITRYNECMGGSSVTFKEDQKWLKIRKGVVAKFAVATMSLGTDANSLGYLINDYQPALAFEYGGNLEFYSPRSNQKFSFTLGLHYISQRFTSLTETTIAGVETIEDTEIQLDQLKMPVGIRRWFNRKDLAPFISAGVQPMLNINKGISTETTTTILDNTVTRNDDIDPFSNFSVSFFAGTGVSKTLKKDKLYLDLEFRYELVTGLTNYLHFSANMQLFALQLGFTF